MEPVKEPNDEHAKSNVDLLKHLDAGVVIIDNLHKASNLGDLSAFEEEKSCYSIGSSLSKGLSSNRSIVPSPIYRAISNVLESF